MIIYFLAKVAGDETEYKGYIEIPNLSDENDAKEVDLNITTETTGPHENAIRSLLR